VQQAIQSRARGCLSAQRTCYKKYNLARWFEGAVAHCLYTIWLFFGRSRGVANDAEEDQQVLQVNVYAPSRCTLLGEHDWIRVQTREDYAQPGHNWLLCYPIMYMSVSVVLNRATATTIIMLQDVLYLWL